MFFVVSLTSFVAVAYFFKKKISITFKISIRINAVGSHHSSADTPAPCADT
jgi:hypothetical protein